MAAKKLKVLISQIIIAGIVFLMLSCNVLRKQNNIAIIENDTLLFLKEIDDEDTNALNVGILFCKIPDEGQIGVVELYNLTREYIAYKMYNNMTFEQYVLGIYHLETEMECDGSLVSCFELNDSVRNLYETNTFTEYLQQTTDISKSRKGSYLVKNSSDMSASALYTVMYYLYINNYYCVFGGDLIGGWYCEKIDDFEERIQKVDLQRDIDMNPYK